MIMFFTTIGRFHDLVHGNDFSILNHHKLISGEKDWMDLYCTSYGELKTDFLLIHSKLME